MEVLIRTCQLTREDKFSTIKRFSVRIGGGFRLTGTKKKKNRIRAVRCRLILGEHVAKAAG